MVDYFSDEFLRGSAEDEQGEEQEASWREFIVILIDAQPSMMELCDIGDEMYHNKTWLEAAVMLASTMLRSKALAGAEDEIAIVFYNTANKKSREGLENVWVERGMSVPDIESIRSLKQFSQEDILQRIGVGSKNARIVALQNGLWQANSLIPDAAARARYRSGGKAPPPLLKVMICTRDATPAPFLSEDSNVGKWASNIAAKGAYLQLIPLISPGTKFDVESFWLPLLERGTPAKTTQSVGNVESATTAVGGDDESERGGADGNFTPFEDEQRVLNLEYLTGVVRMRTYRKRAITRLKWRLGPRGAPEIGIKLYSMLQPSWPMKGSREVWLHGEDNEPLVVSTAQIDELTGLNLTDSNTKPRLYYPKGGIDEARFPRVYVTGEELHQVKHPLPKGITLLGFEPLSSLRPWHQLREATFCYPDESLLAGSTQAFAALLESMLEQRVMAVCAIVRSPAAEPRLVAVVPQQEEVDESFAQVTPPGMHITYLPYADDFRRPEQDQNFTGGARADRTTEHQIAAAEALIDSLHLEEFDSTAIPNPHLQRYYLVLETAALDEDTPSDEIEDLTLPDEDAFGAAEGTVEAFKQAIVGAHGDMGPLQGQGVKRKAAASAAAPVDRDALAAYVEALRIPVVAKMDQLSKLKNDDLKAYLQLQGLSRTGKKADLVERIKAHLTQQNS